MQKLTHILFNFRLMWSAMSYIITHPNSSRFNSVSIVSEKLYKIQDWFEHDKFGVIVSIASPELDKLSNDEIKNLVGDCVVIKNTDSQETKQAQVFDISISNSIIDKKNVNISLGNSIKLSDIKPNSDIVLSEKILVTSFALKS
ncbi:MAG: hypothetical protein QNJ32_26795 [Xenococcaceae cyanobacterium MO_167.B27]|nr:hypothetical protein [Xenococcaceae cyanobacterium MO_167.B27]